MSLKLREIVGNMAGPHVLITGGVHGDEFEPMAAIRKLIQETHPAELSGRVTFVPVVNESAFQRGQRTAEDGLDLARTCPGSATGSITQRIARELSDLIRTADYYIDLHTGGTRLQVLPLSGYVLHRDPKVLDTQRRMARAFGLPLIWGTDPNLDGRSLSVARDAGIPAIYAEYLGGGCCSTEGIQAYVTGCRNVLIELGCLAGKQERSEAEPTIVEDDRPGSGHMQINHPSPIEGFFRPRVRLGDSIRAGTPFGVVSNVLGDHQETVLASKTGRVLVLHTFCRVEKGESLGVILEWKQ